MKRRDFLKRSGQAVALAAVTGATGQYFYDRQRLPHAPVFQKQHIFDVPTDPALPVVSMARHPDPARALRASLDAVGGIRRFVHAGERVTIKPSIGWDRAPEQAANTNPVLVAEMVRLCREAGAEEVIVTDISCNDPRRCFLRSGIRAAAEEAGARVILPADEDFMQVNMHGQLLGVWPVLRHFVQTDRFINMPIVKHHSLTGCTLGMKNLYGILGGRRNRLHQEIDQSIVDLATFVRPTLTVIDATRVLLRGGPQGGSLDDVSAENTVLCTTDQVAGDARAAEFLGLNAADVGHLVLADRSGLGSLDYRAAGYAEVRA